jgi:tetratricopeptide (TPR) repeat protein
MMAESESRSELAPTEGAGKAFFDRADQIAETGNWDYAIEVYVEGLKREPGNIERGHKPLREVSLHRKLQGGKPPGFRDKLKLGASKDPTENLAISAHRLAKDPGNRQYMLQLLKAAQVLELANVIEWVADLIVQEQEEKEPKKRNRQLLATVVDAYESARAFQKAIVACNMIRQANPNDPQLLERIKNLSATMTAQKYSGQGDLLDHVKDREQTQEDMERRKAQQSKSFLEKQLEQAEKDYLASPQVPGKISAYVDALLRMGDPSYEATAIDVLNRAYQETGSYNWKVRIDDIKIKQMTLRYRQLRDRGDKKAALEAARKQVAFELEVFQERAVNYPTDMNLKYELGRRQFAASSVDSDKLDDAIASLQQARREPRRRVAAMILLGQAFAKKQWYQEAADTYNALLEEDLSEDQIKEVRYSLGDALENMGKPDDASEQFSNVAQLDYNYKDVRERLDALRRGNKPNDAG